MDFQADEPDAMLTDPAFRVAPVVVGGPDGGIRWLRRNVARFCDGFDHARRRALVAAELTGMNPAALRATARDRARALLVPGEPVELMSRIARPIPIGTLAVALGFGEPDVTAVRTAAEAYPLDNPDPDADRAVGQLVAFFGGSADESTAAGIGLLVQACEATAGLIGNAARLLAHGDRPADELVAETLRTDPPVRVTRRLAPDGTVRTVDLTRLPFGSGRHACPGSGPAVALACGVLDALRDCRILESHVEYLDSPVLRIPARLTVIRCRCRTPDGG